MTCNTLLYLYTVDLPHVDDRGVCVHQYTGNGECTALIIQQGGGKNFSQVLSEELKPKHGMILVQQTVGHTSRSQTLSIPKCVRDCSFTAFIVGLQLEPDVGHTLLDRSVRIFLSCINTAPLLAENQRGRNKELVAIYTTAGAAVYGSSLAL